jgi:HK97 family phage portal protein
MSLEDAELLGTRQFQARELCRLLGVPGPIVDVGDANFATAQQAAQTFANGCLAPWATSISEEASRSLFLNDRFCLELDLSGLLRGDFATRAQTTINLLRAGAITQNEARHELGWNAVDGGDKLIMQSTGGRPEGVADGAGDNPPRLPGGANGAAASGSAVH